MGESRAPKNIQNALKILNRKPKDAEELAKLIRHQRLELLKQDHEEAKELKFHEEIQNAQIIW